MVNFLGMLHSRVLVLNRSFFPIDITSVRRALCMLYSDIAYAVDHEYQTFDFKSWVALDFSPDHEMVGLVGSGIRIPRVVLLRAYDRMPKRVIRFSRTNILLRDGHTCQYCGVRKARSHLNLDHVVPRSRGGKTTWENVVTSCLPCNLTKGGRSPEEAGLLLIRKPFRPSVVPFLGLASEIPVREQWRPFLKVVERPLERVCA